MNKNEFKAINGEVVKAPISNDQKHDRPFKYFVGDADLNANIAVARGLTEIDSVEENIRYALKVGLDNLTIVVNGTEVKLSSIPFNIGRTMDKNVVNVGTSPEQQSKYKLLMAEPEKAKPVATNKLVIPPLQPPQNTAFSKENLQAWINQNIPQTATPQTIQTAIDHLLKAGAPEVTLREMFGAKFFENQTPAIPPLPA